MALKGYELKKTTLHNRLHFVEAQAWSMNVCILEKIEVAYNVVDVVQMLAGNLRRLSSK